MLIGATLAVDRPGRGTGCVLRVRSTDVMPIRSTPASCSPTTTPSCAAGCGSCSTREPDLEVVAEAGDGAEAVELALAEDIDLAILDVAMPRMTGLQAAREITQRSAPTSAC